MGHEIPVVPVPEAEVQVLARVLLADRQASFELDPERLNPVLVVGQEGRLPSSRRPALCRLKP